MWFVKTKTAYEMRISDWSSDVCSSDLCSGVSANESHTLSKVSILVICHLSSVRCSSETRNHTPVHRERAKPQLSVSSHASSQPLRQTPTLVRRSPARQHATPISPGNRPSNEGRPHN